MYKSLINKIPNIVSDKTDLSVITVSSEPVEIIAIPNFLSTNECNYLCKFLDKLKIDNSFVSLYSDDVVKTISLRLSAILDIPVSNAEYMFLGTFRPAVTYDETIDTNISTEPRLEFESEDFAQWSPHGNRLFSCTIFLNENFVGGTLKYPDISVDILPEEGKLVIVNLLNEKSQPIKNCKSVHLSVNSNKHIAQICFREQPRYTHETEL